MENQHSGMHRMAMGRPTMIQFRKLIVWPVAPVSTPMATMLNELPAGVTTPPMTAAMGMAIIMHLPSRDLPGWAPAALSTT